MKRYRYSYHRNWNWIPRKPSKTAKLIQLIGPDVLNKIVKIFYNAKDHELSMILDRYGKYYGDNAKKYAQRNIKKWKSGQVKISGQTQERLVKLVPVFLKSEDRYMIAKEICNYHNQKQRKKTSYVTINIEDPTPGLSELEKTIENFYESTDLIELPEKLTSAIEWLSDNDITIARNILAKAEEEDAKSIENHAYNEIQEIERHIKSGIISEIDQTIEFPNGYIAIRTYIPKKPLFTRVVKALFG